MPNEKTDGYLLVPDGEGFAPAVISVYYEPENAAGISEKPFRDFAHQLVKRGYVTLSIETREASRAGHTPKRWEALNHAVQVNKVLGFTVRIAMTNRETHSPNQL